MTWVLCGKVPTRVRGKIYSTVVQLAMLYVVEVVPYQQNRKDRSGWDEDACGGMRRDWVRNERVWETLGMESITAICRRSWSRWFRHTERKENDYVDKRATNMELLRRRRDGSKRRWSDNIHRLGPEEHWSNERRHFRPRALEKADCCSNPTSTWEQLEEASHKLLVTFITMSSEICLDFWFYLLYSIDHF